MSKNKHCHVSATGNRYEYSTATRVSHRTLVTGTDSYEILFSFPLFSLFFFFLRLGEDYLNDRTAGREDRVWKDCPGNMSHDLNSSSSSELPLDDDARDEYLARWEIAVLTSIFLITIIGNVLVLLALYARRRYQRRKFTRMYFFIMHLSVADLLTGLFDVLPQLAWDITFR